MADGLAREGFDLDLAFGEARESAFVAALRDCRVECKSDQKARISGHVFIEYKQHGRPSGIATTVARWYSIEVDDDKWVTLRTSELKALCEAAIKAGKSVSGGDNKAYLGALVPVEWLTRRWREA